MDDEKDKLNRFQEAFERGQEGQISDYETWLQDQGIDPDKADREYVRQLFRENPEKAVNHEEELEEVAEYIGFFSERSSMYHLPVIGVTGIGKTQFVHTVSDLLSQIEPGIEQRFFRADEFTEIGVDEEKIFEIRDSLQSLDKVVVYVDDCQWAESESLIESFSIINETVEDAFLVTSWTPEYWIYHREDVEPVVPSSTEIHLSAFNEDYSLEALNQTLSAISDEKLDVRREFFKKIYGYSTGIPGVFTDLLMTSLREAFVKDLELGSVESVDAAAGKLNLKEVEETVYELSDTKVTILTHILLETQREGIRPSQLVDLLDRDKSTVSYHLKDLQSSSLIESNKQGRSAYYSVKNQVKPFIQARIARNREYNG